MFHAVGRQPSGCLADIPFYRMKTVCAVGDMSRADIFAGGD